MICFLKIKSHASFFYSLRSFFPVWFFSWMTSYFIYVKMKNALVWRIVLCVGWHKWKIGDARTGYLFGAPFFCLVAYKYTEILGRHGILTLNTFLMFFVMILHRVIIVVRGKPEIFLRPYSVGESKPRDNMTAGLVRVLTFRYNLSIFNNNIHNSYEELVVSIVNIYFA